MFLEVQRGQFIVAGNNTNYLQTALSIILRNRCDTQRFLLAAASPAGSKFEKNRDSFVILGINLPAETVHERKFEFLSFQRQGENQAHENGC
jgi:hypothetical protein